MRKDWEVKKLGDVAISDLGKTLNKSKDTGVLLPYLCSINVQWNKIDLSTQKEALFEDSEINKYSVKKGDLLVCEGGDIGRAAIWNEDYSMLYQNALHRMRFNKNIIAEYVLYFLWRLKRRGVLDKRYAKGVTIKHLVKSSLLSINIPVPPLQTQQLIVEELDCLTSIIEKQKKQLEELDNLAQSIFYDMFGDPIENEKGWKKKSLGTLCEVSSAKRVLVKDVVSEGVPFIRGTELAILSKQCFFDKSIFSMFITPEHYEKVKAITGVPEINDLLIPSINPYGYVWKINTTEPIYFKDGRVIWIHTNHSIYNGDCLRHILVYEILEKYSKLSGAVFAELTLEFLRTLKIIVPPLPLQQQFAAKIEAIEKQKELIKKSIKETEDLFNSRMDYYFN